MPSSAAATLLWASFIITTQPAGARRAEDSGGLGPFLAVGAQVLQHDSLRQGDMKWMGLVGKEVWTCPRSRNASGSTSEPCPLLGPPGSRSGKNCLGLKATRPRPSGEEWAGGGARQRRRALALLGLCLPLPVPGDFSNWRAEDSSAPTPL